MNFQYELNKQDLIDFNLFHINYSKLTRRTYFLQRYIVSLSFLVLPLLLRQFMDIPSWYFVIFIVLYLYWVTFYPKRLKKIVTRKISKMVFDGKNSSVLGVHNLSISEHGILDKSEHSEAKTEFSAINDIVEDKEHIFIYVSENSAHIIPRRIFENEERKNQLLGFLRQQAGHTNKSIGEKYI